jgi:hypothetical protein
MQSVYHNFFFKPLSKARIIEEEKFSHRNDYQSNYKMVRKQLSQKEMNSVRNLAIADKKEIK